MIYDPRRRQSDSPFRFFPFSFHCSLYSSTSLNSLNSFFVARVLANKLVALALLIGIGIWFLVIPAITNQLGANPIERLLHVSGEIAICILRPVFSFTPLPPFFPPSSLRNTF